MIKKRFFCICTAALLFTACTSLKDPILFMLVDEGRQQYFVRPQEAKKDGMFLSIDFTLRVFENRIDSDVTVNYSLRSKNYSMGELEKSSLILVSSNGEFPLTEEKLLFRELKTGLVRLTATLSARNMEKFLIGAEYVTIILKDPSGAQYQFHSKKIQDTLLLLEKSLL